ncbi:MAG: DUF3667 domain-containing protein [Vicingaceae bacterium]
MLTTPKQDELEHLSHLPDRQCQNCDFIYDGYFCPRCGQRYMEGRFEFKESTEWVMAQLFNLDKGFFHTIWGLIKKPGKVVHDYLNKATIRYMHPFRFAFIVATISALVTVLSGAFESTELAHMMPDQNEAQVERMEKLMDFIKKYMSLIMVLSIPFYAIASFLIYKKKKYNFTEHLILNSYAYAHSLIIALPLTFLVLLPNGIVLNGTLSTIVGVLVVAWVYASFFKENFFISLLKSILTSIIAVVFAMIGGGIISIIAALVALFFK